MRVLLIACVVLSCAFIAERQFSFADELLPAPVLQADEIIITASRYESSLFNAPYSADSITADELRNRLFVKSMPEAFNEEPSIAVQKTAAGMGSPYIRGFTGFRTLFMVDGIRLNNSVFRDGPNQYWNTVDPFSINQLEIIKGPASVLYGSDAIGGTVNALTSYLKIGEEKHASAYRIFDRYSSPDNSNIIRTDVESIFGGSGPEMRVSLGATQRNNGDIIAGGDTGLQDKTGYSDAGMDFKFEFAPSPNARFAAAFQDVSQTNIWRTHRTIYSESFHDTAVGTDKRHSFDQRRQLAYVQYETALNSKFISRLKTSLSYQIQEEDQFVIKKDDKTEKSGFDVNTLGLWFQAETIPFKFGRIIYGAEYYLDNVDSYMKKYKANGSLDKIEIQGPVADNASYVLSGIFLQDELALSEKVVLTAGLRFTSASADADKVKDPVTGSQIELSHKWSNTVGNLRIAYYPDANYNLYAGLSQGFRAPNLSDLTRYDIAQSGQKEIPNTSLSPEKFLSYEAGFKARGEKWNAAISFFYTDISDMIMRFPTGAMIGGSYEVQKSNIGNGFVYGAELKADYKLSGEWALSGGVANARGEVSTYAASMQEISAQPMNKVQPLQGLIGVKWEQKEGKYWAEFSVRGAGRQDRLSPEDKLDIQRIPPGGTPGWMILNVKAGLNIAEYCRLSAGIENIGDEDYRIHGSGSNEPGRNLVLGVELKF
ncbi:MAG: TonB-dependent receptor [Planctomycetes bacterium]|nr:TonB-dependent receptor [Planctomycetota bacterium]